MARHGPGDGGDDSLAGGAGEDSLYGDAGDDRLSGGADADVLAGGPGDDRLDGGPGADFQKSAEGTDRCPRQPRSARLVASSSSAALPVRRNLAPTAAGLGWAGANGSISGWQTVPSAGSTPLMR